MSPVHWAVKKKKKRSPLYQILSETFHPCTLHACSSSPHVSKTALLEVTDSSFPTRNEDAQLLWVQQGAKLPSGKTHLHGPLHKNACQHHGCTEYFHLLLQLPPLWKGMVFSRDTLTAGDKGVGKQNHKWRKGVICSPDKPASQPFCPPPLPQDRCLRTPLDFYKLPLSIEKLQ